MINNKQQQSSAKMFFVALLVACALAAQPSWPTKHYGVDVSQPVSTSEWQCLLQQGLEFGIVRVFRSTGNVDPAAVQTIADGHKAGVRMDGYMFPCPKCGTSGADQVGALMKHLNSSGAVIGTLWFDIEESTPYWTSSHSLNQQFFASLLHGAAQHGVVAGVYSNWVQWPAIFGSFNVPSQVPLWYPHYDGQPTFNDFKPFGGFSRSDVVIKQFSDKGAKCSSSYDINWRPSW
jgi:GH25 family lysozyme M1 (1,4-beta-N-acetylmuramidase)